MMHMTIKLRITLWFTVCMLLLSVLVFAFIALLSNTATSFDLQAALMALVEENMEEVEYDDGELDVDDDFVSFESGIYCLVFSSAGVKHSGYAPYAALENEPFEDGVIRSVQVGLESYLIYDRMVTDKHHPSLWIRGIVLESGNAITSSAMYRAAFIALPLLILLSAVGGYIIARRSLRPIQDISHTAEEIGSSGDLSKRIEMEGAGDELHALADTFNRMFDRLEINFEAERHFTSDAAHELRTPIATILAQCEYAFEHAQGEADLYEAIGAIQKQGYRMSRLMESLLYFTRLEQGTQAPALELIDISEIVSSVCTEQTALGEKSIVLTSSVQPGIKRNGDGALFARMAENLIKNAYRYGRENGSIHVSLKSTGSGVLLSVSDDGIGIAQEELPNIWNRFYRVDKSRNYANSAGFGLGLSMVKQIAQLHGGKLQVKSQLGQGSTFSILF